MERETERMLPIGWHRFENSRTCETELWPMTAEKKKVLSQIVGRNHATVAWFQRFNMVEAMELPVLPEEPELVVTRDLPPDEEGRDRKEVRDSREGTKKTMVWRYTVETEYESDDQRRRQKMTSGERWVVTHLEYIPVSPEYKRYIKNLETFKTFYRKEERGGADLMAFLKAVGEVELRTDERGVQWIEFTPTGVDFCHFCRGQARRDRRLLYLIPATTEMGP